MKLFIFSLLSLLILNCTGKEEGPASDDWGGDDGDDWSGDGGGTPPSVAIESPVDGTYFEVDQSIHFVGDVIPGAGEALQGRWTAASGSLELTLCDEQPVHSSGKTECHFDDGFPAAGNVDISLMVVDEFESAAMAAISINIVDDENEAPSITFGAPEENSRFTPSDTIEFLAIASDDQDNLENLEIRLSSDIDGTIESGSNPDASGTWAFTTSAADLSGGTHLLTLVVYDDDGKSGSDIRTITINAPPSAPVVAISPDPVSSGEALTVDILEDSIDPEGGSVSYSYRWTFDGIEWGGSTPTVSDGITQKDQYWTVEVTPNDGDLSGTPATASITIGNSPPSLESVNIVPASPLTVDTLTALPTGWFDQDGDPENYTYQWTINGIDEPDHTLMTLNAVHTQKGDVVSVTMTPFDSESTGEPVTSDTTIIGNTPPSAGTARITPSSPGSMDDLICEIIDLSTDIDGDAIDYVLRWYRDDIPELSVYGLGPAIIPASDTSPLETWTCTVTPSDGTDDGTPFSDEVLIWS